MSELSTDVVLVAKNLGKYFQDGENKEIRIIEALDFEVNRGDRIAIIGPSGSGKTTLLQMLGGLDTPTTGSVTLQGQAFSDLKPKQRGDLRNQKIGFVYQFHHLLPEFTALENVAIGFILPSYKLSRSALVNAFSALITPPKAPLCNPAGANHGSL